MADQPQTPRTSRSAERIPVKVVVRCRPMSQKEANAGSTQVVATDSDGREVKVQQNTGGKYVSKTYMFDEVFGPSSTQAEVYDTAVKPIVEEVLAGYNCTIFAYGQTSTGKTFTMEGERDLSDSSKVVSEKSGVIFRAVNQIFSYLADDETCEYTVRVSCLELYNEELADLLSVDENKRLRIYEDPRKGTTVSNVEEVAVACAQDILVAIDNAAKRRQVAETQLNRNSSRSHVITTITIHIKESTPDGEDLFKTGKLNLVDLAGSENIGRSGAVDKRAKEAGMINQSLLTLGRVITALTEHSPHVPYRESKLTRLLQESLGGRAKTCIIATVSPASVNIDESMSTLDYAHRAKNIRNKPEVNQKMTKKALLREMASEIEGLKAELSAAREKNGVYLPVEKYTALEADLQFKTTRLAEIETQLADKEKEFVQLQQMFAVKEGELQAEVVAHGSTREVLAETSDELKVTKDDYERTATTLDQKEFVLTEYMSTEDRLYAEADTLLSKLQSALGDCDGLFSKIARKSNVEAMNAQRTAEFGSSMESMLSEATLSMQTFACAYHERSLGVQDELRAFASMHSQSTSQIKSQMNSMHVAMASVLQQSLQSTVDAYATKVSDDTHPALVEMQARFAAQLEQAFTNMSSLFTSYAEDATRAMNRSMGVVAAMQQHVSSKMLEMQQNAEQFEQTQTGIMRDIAASLQTNSQQMQDALRSKDAQIAELLQKQAAVAKEKRAAMAEMLMRALAEADAAEELAVAQITAECASMASAASQSAQELVQFATTEIHENVMQPLSAFTAQQVSSTASDLTVQMNEMTIVEQTAFTSTENVLSAVVEKQLEALDANTRMVADQQTTFRQQLAEAVLETRSFRDTFAVNVAQACTAMESEKLSMLGMIDSAEAQTVRSMEERVAAVQDSDGELQSFATETMVVALSNAVTHVKNFTEGRVEDMPTGKTPMKKEVIVPAELPKTRPTDAILADWEASRRSSGQVQGKPEAAPQPLRMPFRERTSNTIADIAAMSPSKGSMPRLALNEVDAGENRMPTA